MYLAGKTYNFYISCEEVSARPHQMVPFGNQCFFSLNFSSSFLKGWFSVQILGQNLNK